jgi:capsular polysaccharide biosynthesis protein
MIALDVESGSGPRRIDLLSYLDAEAEERAHEDAYAWIKAVRHLRVSGEPFRSRFTFRDDSLWWFAELYLHKEQRILRALRAIAAFDALVERDRPRSVRFVAGSDSGVIEQVAAARRIPYRGPGWNRSAWPLVKMDARSTALAAGARLSRLRSNPPRPAHACVAAFVHRAFWRTGGGDGGAESYIGPVLRALESRLPPEAIQYVGIGARTNFRARRWWDPIAQSVARGSAAPSAERLVPIERYAPARALAASSEIYRTRHTTRRQLSDSADLRAHAVIRGCDCWPMVREQLAGIALLQFPWSARAMDEAAAALDAIEPDVAVTYAEAGGWGRALALESRRRGIPLAGLQHGFIYRHWLNYRHEPDEMLPGPEPSGDRGFPYPASTLLFDEHAAQHLSTAGRFPASALAVTGSARLDELMAAVRGLTHADIETGCAESGATTRPIVLFAGKEREARPFLPALMEAIREMPDVHLVIKPHPAETPGVYATAVDGLPNARVVSAGSPLPPLLAAARALVTVNSTVAIDGLALGLPAVVIGLPNNLSPFVDAGEMLGAGSAEEIRAALSKLLYDQEFRSTMASRMSRPVPGDGQSARRSADTILALARPASRDGRVNERRE